MKHQLLTFLLIFALLLTTTGCSAAGVGQKLDAAGDRVENGLDAVEDTVENAIQRAAAPAPAAAPTQTAPTNAAVAGITRDGAEKIALDYVGLTADQVARLHTEYEIDNGVPQYDVEFHQGEWEYEFEISAEDGRILSYDKDHEYD